MDEARILAAGGLLWRDGARRELAVIHRHRYGDWSLPKGKLEPGETFAVAARREVEEETGHDAGIVGWAGETLYRVGQRWKSVVFFEMVCARAEPVCEVDPDEVTEVVWLTPDAALDRLSHDNERDLVARCVGD